jgi:hypothetical protein
MMIRRSRKCIGNVECARLAVYANRFPCLAVRAQFDQAHWTIFFKPKLPPPRAQRPPPKLEV